jgi:hypothetical protein
MLSYDDHKQLNKLEKLADEKANERQVLAALKTLRYKVIDKKVLNKVLDYFTTKDNKDKVAGDKEIIPMSFYKDPNSYESFMDFFSRKLTDKKFKEINDNAKKCDMIIPNECYVEAIGSFKDTEKILRLKKKSKDVLGELKKVDINVPNYHYIDMKLLCSYYHRVHAPVSGKITTMIPIEGHDDFFGSNSLWIVGFETKKVQSLF